MSVERFSVLMVTYAGEQAAFLGASLQSLLDQTRPADEIVLVCAGRLPDEQEKVIAGFSASLPLVRVDLEQNQHLGPSLNLGLQHATHEWVARMDSDDICVADRFRRQLDYLAEHPGVDLLGGAIAEFADDPNRPVSRRPVPETHHDIAKMAFQRTPFNHMTVFYRKSAVLAVGSYRDYLGYEDFDLWTRMLVSGAQMANLSNILVHARIGNGFHSRRGGLAYALAEWHALGEANLINPGNRWKVWLLRPVRFAVRLLPGAVRSGIYTLFRR